MINYDDDAEVEALGKKARDCGMKDTRELNQFQVEIVAILKKCCEYKNPASDLANITLVLSVVIANITDLFHIKRGDIKTFLTDFCLLVEEIIDEVRAMNEKNKEKLN